MADLALVPAHASSQGTTAAAAVACSRVEPRSVHGLLWLQTHFENHQWELVCSGRAQLTASSSEQLRWDAEASGLTVVTTASTP